MDIHKSAVDAICARVRQFHDAKTPFRIYHGSTNSTRHLDFDPSSVVDVSSLNHILSIDVEKRTAVVEPNVPMDVLVRATMKAGLLPPVVMEFPGITVGGGFVGTAGESSSFKHGFFDRTVLSAEVVLANGQTVTASASSNSDLFEGLRGSFGTLGVLTMVEMRLVEMKKFVEMTYYPTTSIEGAMAKLEEETKNEENDYLDGVLFARNSGVVVSGRLVDACAKTDGIRRFSRAWDQWFYLHAESLAAKSTVSIELVPVEDYLFRYDRGAFWTAAYAYQYFWIPFNRFTRWLLDYFMHTRVMYHALHASGHTDRYIIQDLALPAGNAAAFTQYIDSAFGLYPLWLCPLRKDGRESMGHPLGYRGAISGAQNESGKEYEGLYINVGVWGPHPSSQEEYVGVNRDLEAKVRELGGLKWLYARVFYNEDEFWGIYDKKKYTALREKYGATSLPTVWDKVKDRQGKEDVGGGARGALRRFVKRWGLLSGLYGVYKAVLGGDYLLKKKRP
ncbi:FAD binding domain-containing protein [Melanomma pulvis-pyrius CBS 109.77]|uniref:Delta(24)-sterol reductase n=1 Tax=Melanomma pulvis-pyrius CBS 109.77 TaxID=1314802 RepID=A0A6A6X2F5_9PLEO|nr:FAD binding domain-containing protein [Melanomma pulvis-pyrius CBS 109.77]